MKKLISLSLALIMIAALVFAVPASAADGLSVTADGKNAKTFNVGDEFIYTVALNAGDKAILDGQVVVTYDAQKVRLIEYKEEGKTAEDYSFPESIVATKPVCNYGTSGTIKFNFSSDKAVAVFKNNEFFCRFRFKALAAGSSNISTSIEYMIDVDEARIYYGGKAGDGKNPSIVSSLSDVSAPVTTVTIKIGDLNNDGKVDNRDAMIIDRYVAGWSGYRERIVYFKSADLNEDSNVNNRDAMILDRYVAGWAGYDKYIKDIEIEAA